MFPQQEKEKGVKSSELDDDSVDMETLFETFPELREWDNTAMSLLDEIDVTHTHFYNRSGSPPQQNCRNSVYQSRTQLIQDCAATRIPPMSTGKNQPHRSPSQQNRENTAPTQVAAMSLAEHSPPEVTNIQERLPTYPHQSPPQNGGSSVSVPRKKWSDDEHRLFLEGLEKYGKGNWRRISTYVNTKTPTQVASHAQKYFLHQHAPINKKRKRKSIHNITLQDKELVSHYIDQHIWVPSPNLAMQEVHEMHHSSSHHVNQQNWIPNPNLSVQQLHEIHYSVPHNVVQQNLIPSSNLGMEQNTRNDSFESTNQHASSKGGFGYFGNGFPPAK